MPRKRTVWGDMNGKIIGHLKAIGKPISGGVLAKRVGKSLLFTIIGEFLRVWLLTDWLAKNPCFWHRFCELRVDWKEELRLGKVEDFCTFVRLEHFYGAESLTISWIYWPWRSMLSWVFGKRVWSFELSRNFRLILWLVLQIVVICRQRSTSNSRTFVKPLHLQGQIL